MDWDRLADVVHRGVRFLDNVIDVNEYPLPKIAELARGNRKIGLGVMGWADMLIKMGIGYDSEDAVALGEKVMGFIDAEAHSASRKLAEERGAFPNFEGSIYDTPEGAQMRNATVTTIAPTGTLSIIANCSSGIEPLFAVSYVRTVMDNDRLIEVNPVFEELAVHARLLQPRAHGRSSPTMARWPDIDEVPEDVRRVFVTAHDIAPVWHIRMQAAFQKHTDNAVSKTVNFAQRGDARRRPRGVRPGVRARREGRHDLPRRQQGEPGAVDGQDRVGAPRARSQRHGEIEPRPRPAVTQGRTEKIKTGCGTLYVTINRDEHGLCEVFTQMGKSGGCASSQSEALSRLISRQPARRGRSERDREASARHPLPVAHVGRGREGAVVRGRRRHRARALHRVAGDRRVVDRGRQEHGRARQPRGRLPGVWRRSRA